MREALEAWIPLMGILVLAVIGLIVSIRTHRLQREREELFRQIRSRKRTFFLKE